MRKILIPALTVLICALIISVIPTDAEGAIYDDTVRLHIIASSDTREDQELKLAVRDAVLLEFGTRLSVAKNADEAAKRTELLLSEIEDFVKKTVRGLGVECSVKVSLSKEHYGTREYEGFTLPAGEYSSLRIILGEGEGRNWWCVMYPPMCLGASLEGDGAVNYTKEEIRLIRGDKYRVKFKILELLSENFG